MINQWNFKKIKIRSNKKKTITSFVYEGIRTHKKLVREWLGQLLSIII